MMMHNDYYGTYFDFDVFIRESTSIFELVSILLFLSSYLKGKDGPDKDNAMVRKYLKPSNIYT